MRHQQIGPDQDIHIRNFPNLHVTQKFSIRP
ncbi:MAG: hypothetical protein JWO51_192 [Rhodospirillales bacterium]|nr:hypothetical protein [Rhodospirillales bacterium]